MYGQISKKLIGSLIFCLAIFLLGFGLIVQSMGKDGGKKEVPTAVESASPSAQDEDFASDTPLPSDDLVDEDWTEATGSAVKSASTAPKATGQAGSSASVPASASPFKSTRERVKVVRVVDGDTVELADGRKLRYIGIDTPETVKPNTPVQCGGKDASNKNKELVEGKEVEIEKDVSETDRYGRLLRYVYVGEVMVNHYLVAEGLAQSSSYPPDVKYQEVFRAAQRAAQEAGKGLWGSCTTGNEQTSSSPVLSAATTASSPSNTPSASCLIKGNISSSGDKIFHTPGCGSYEKTVINEVQGERWFCSENEATQAGWRKAKNC